MSLDVSLAREPAGVADSGAEAQETLGGGHERLRWPIENGYDGREQLGVRFKRVPVAPIYSWSGAKRCQRYTSRRCPMRMTITTSSWSRIA